MPESIPCCLIKDLVCSPIDPVNLCLTDICLPLRGAGPWGDDNVVPLPGSNAPLQLRPADFVIAQHRGQSCREARQAVMQGTSDNLPHCPTQQMRQKRLAAASSQPCRTSVDLRNQLEKVVCIRIIVVNQQRAQLHI